MKLSRMDKTQYVKNNKATISLMLTQDFLKDFNYQVPDELHFIKETIELKHFKGKTYETLFIPLVSEPNIILTGLGKKKQITRESLRNTASSIIDTCNKKKINTVSLFLPELESLKENDILKTIAEGLYLSNYSFNKYKSKKNSKTQVSEAVLYTNKIKNAPAILKKVSTVCKNTLLCRDLINETSDNANPIRIAAQVRKLSRLKGISCKVLGEKQIAKLKMGLLQAVSRGSTYPPQLIILKYRGNPKSKKSVAIVGKGITFDSGGINLKPSGHIEDMRSDMSGAAVCIHTIKAAAELGIKQNIFGVIPLCENMISKTSYKPGDIFTAYNGKTVEIGNTDAEGRLILADALAYTEDKIKPEYIIDCATLTGACLIALGETIAAFLTKDETLAGNLFNAGELTGDRLWRLPLYRKFQEELKSDFADLSNIASGRNAGTIIGATFLGNFVKNTPWAHIDIAGTSWYSKKRGYRPKHATGFGVRLFIDFLEKLKL